MTIVRRSELTGIERSMEFNVTEEMFEVWDSGVALQHAFPHLLPDQREFIMSGITAEEWDSTFEE